MDPLPASPYTATSYGVGLWTSTGCFRNQRQASDERDSVGGIVGFICIKVKPIWQRLQLRQHIIQEISCIG